jgi:DNA-binding response OmpR family regulator
MRVVAVDSLPAAVHESRTIQVAHPVTDFSQNRVRATSESGSEKPPLRLHCPRPPIRCQESLIVLGHIVQAHQFQPSEGVVEGTSQQVLRTVLAARNRHFCYHLVTQRAPRACYNPYSRRAGRRIEPIGGTNMHAARIVVVEDERAIRRGVVDALRASGYEVAEAADGEAGLNEAMQPGVDLVLLDLLLPRRDGLEVLRQLRCVRATLPVIVLTARGGEDDRVRGLKMGADDYVVKPFSARELLARVEAVLRRALGRPAEVRGARLGRAVIDLQRREIRWSRKERGELSETESALLAFLLVNRERAVSRDELLTRLWGIEPMGLETRTIDMHVARLRTKLRDPSGRTTPEAILTVRALGYMAAPELLPLEQTSDHENRI